MNNPFENPAFSMSALTAAINILPNNYGLMDSMGLFPSKPVRFRSVVVEEKNGILTLLPTMPVGSPGTVGKRGKRKLRSFAIPHIPHDDVVLPEEVQGIRAFGSESELQTIASVMAEHLQTMRNKHAITLEHLRMGALKGIILDADGSELYNLFDLFDITPKVVNFQLGSAATDIKKKCLDLKRYLEKNLKGERMSGVHCLGGILRRLHQPRESSRRLRPLAGQLRAALGYAFWVHLRRHYLRGVFRRGQRWRRQHPSVH